jgi:hypothetical protein
VVLDATGQLLVVRVYCAFVKYLRKNRERGEAIHQLFQIQETNYSVRTEVLYNILIELVLS